MSFRIIITLVGLVAGGCAGGATVVRQDARGGEIVLSGPAVPAAQKARAAMLEHCDSRYDLLEEGDRLIYVCTSHLLVAQAQR